MKKIFLFFTFLFLMISFANAESASTLNNINVMTSPYNTVVNISFSEPVTFTEGKLTDSKKIYFDFKNAILRSPINLTVGTNFVAGIRSAQNAVTPEYITRVVFDMDKITDYKIQTYDNISFNVIFEEYNPNPTVVTEDKKTNNTVTKTEENKVTETIVSGITNAVTNAVTEVVTPIVSTSRSSVDRSKDKAKVIVIDAGHGGKDPGAIFDSINEKDLNLDIAKRLRKLLEADGYKVIMTRTTDVFVELTERAEIANRNNADLFICVHNNSMPTNFKGAMTLYSPRDIQNDFSSKDLATIVQKHMEDNLGNGSIGARERTNLVVLNKTTMPAIIAEVSCMSNKNDLKLLKTARFRQAAANGLYEAIKEVYSR
ncbi:MAG: N-acetylmuramoyl-L-alanine amidase [Clostridia bacterium]|nr:N-acetylmuramoyl-L-alanine amidase [Clostridia bacterium]